MEGIGKTEVFAQKSMRGSTEGQRIFYSRQLIPLFAVFLKSELLHKGN